MFPNIFQYVAASDPVKALIGTSPVRFWPFSMAPQKGQPGYAVPYAVWQSPYGTPENYLNQLPDIDNLAAQIDIYALTVDSARASAIAIRNAVEPYGHVVSYNGEEKDSATGLYRVGFTVEFWQDH